MDALSRALWLAECGFHVFPLHPGSKEPAVSSWPDKATTDPETIKKLFRNRPQHNVAVATGFAYSDKWLFVLDVDTKRNKDGGATLAELENKHGNLPPTYIVETASGGYHYYFLADKQTGNTAGRLGEGLDTRGKGGYVVAPGSMIEFENPVGPLIGEADSIERFYQDARNFAVAEAPGWLVDLLDTPAEREDTSTPAIEELDTEGAIRRATYYLKEQAPEAVEGQGGDSTTYFVACRVMDYGVSPAKCFDLMADHYNDTKCTPPWDIDDLEKKVHNAASYHQSPTGNAAPEADFEAVESDDNSEPPQEPGKKTGLELIEGGTVEPNYYNPYLIDGIIDMKSSSMLYGPPGVGKSFVTLDMSWHIAMGRPWNGRRTRQGAVLYLQLEGGNRVFDRIAALRQHYETEENVPFFLSRTPVNLSTQMRDTRFILDAVDTIENEYGHKCQLIVVDTLARAMDGDENSAQDIGAVFRRLDFIRDRCGVHTMIIHHAGKDSSRGARGSNALKGAVDTEIRCDGQDNRGEIKSEKQRDTAKSRPITYSLKSMNLGEDQDGYPIDTCVVELEERSAIEDFDDPVTEILAAVDRWFEDNPDNGLSKRGFVRLCEKLSQDREDRGFGPLTTATRKNDRERTYSNYLHKVADFDNYRLDNDVLFKTLS